jgi:hypothetical protein
VKVHVAAAVRRGSEYLSEEMRRIRRGFPEEAPSATAERIGNLVKYTTNRENGRVAKKRVTFRRAACKQGRTFQTVQSKCKNGIMSSMKNRAKPALALALAIVGAVAAPLRSDAASQDLRGLIRRWWCV